METRGSVEANDGGAQTTEREKESERDFAMRERGDEEEKQKSPKVSRRGKEMEKTFNIYRVRRPEPSSPTPRLLPLRLLPPLPLLLLLPPSPTPAPPPPPPLLLPSCSAADLPLHHSSAEHHLRRLLPSSPFSAASHDLRAALRLLLHHHSPPHPTKNHRFLGLLTNRHKFDHDTEDDEEREMAARLREGARLMSMARRMRDGLDVGEVGECEEEEMALFVVMTNGVEVQVDDEGPIGVAVYGPGFSWINHSCSPNACYRFSVAGSSEEDSGGAPMRFVASGDETNVREWTRGNGELGTGEFAKCHRNGPSVIVRSIKPIRKGEEVYVAYYDLLQHKLSIFPDNILQGFIVPPCPELMHSTCHCKHNVYVDEAYKELSARINEAICDYLSLENPEPCIENLENALAQSLEEERWEQQSRASPRVHPLHHLSLNAYITLSSAYNVYASYPPDSGSGVNGQILSASDLKRTVAAYSLLLAGAVQRLFQSEFSLVANAAHFWISAGGCLANLGGSMSYNSISRRKAPDSNIPPMCSLMDKLLSNLNCQESPRLSAKGEFHEISEAFIHCVSRISSRVWPFMIKDRPYLKDIKHPVDFSWLLPLKGSDNEKSCAMFDSGTAGCGENGMCLGCWACTAEDCNIEEKKFVYQLAAHCLLYGGYLVRICYGRRHYLYNYVRDFCGSEMN
ncbi:hypothetical protein Scep_002266 [Stephania cephalantha]|uniref:SET domain-containing protein n=1 Tax=Stephania cephalantha TaxID=152367 RepID=A0AAP0LAP4_9MAGN